MMWTKFRRGFRQVGLDEQSAFMTFNLAPLCVRRGVAILGVIHTAALLDGPPSLWKFFRRDFGATRRVGRLPVRHSVQLIEWPPGRDLDVMRRSALGMIRVYNLLPEEAVAKCDLKSFQRTLTQLVRDRVVAGDTRWKELLSCRHRLLQHHPLVR